MQYELENIKAATSPIKAVEVGFNNSFNKILIIWINKPGIGPMANAPIRQGRSPISSL